MRSCRSGACLMNDILDRNHPPHEQIVVGKGRNTLPQASGQLTSGQGTPYLRQAGS
uniref:Uncharacterized protein n=1 Tax=Picea glauca TaxID=3330 RepID=A0A101LYL2_PICGL|nr:hypothetical protein ABT39_MTgene5946 [Picea glauca]